MKKLMENKLVLAGIGAVVVMAIIVSVIFFQNQKKAKEVAGPEQTAEEQAVQMKPEDIGLKLTPNASNTEVTLEISDVTKFTSFDYEMNYDAIVDGESVPRGAIGSGEVTDGKPIKRSVTIGTCSAGKCKYDTGVTKVSFVIRLNLKDGKTGVVSEDLPLE